MSTAIVAFTTRRRLLVREKKGSIFGSLKPKEWIKKEDSIEIDGNLPKDALKLLSLRVMLVLNKAPKSLLKNYGKTLRIINGNPELKEKFDLMVTETATKVRPWVN